MVNKPVSLWSQLYELTRRSNSHYQVGLSSLYSCIVAKS